MKLVVAAFAAVLLAGSAAAQSPQQPPPKPDTQAPQPEARGRIIGHLPTDGPRPTAVPCEVQGGLIEPVVKFCPLPADAPWPPPPKPAPKTGIFPLDQT